MKLSIQEQNRLSNEYRRMATAAGIVSPFRQSEYIKARLKGKSHDAAVASAKKGPRS